MGQVLERKPGAPIATTWTSNFSLDLTVLICMIYIWQFNACATQATLHTD